MSPSSSTSEPLLAHTKHRHLVTGGGSSTGCAPKRPYWSLTGLADRASSVCARGAILPFAVVDALFRGLRQYLGHQREALDNVVYSRWAMKIADLEAQLLSSREAFREAKRLWDRERECVLADFEARLKKASDELENCSRAMTGLRACLEMACVPIVSVDPGGFIKDWNRKATEVFACNGELAFRHRLADFACADDAPGLDAALSAVVKAATKAPSSPTASASSLGGSNSKLTGRRRSPGGRPPAGNGQHSLRLRPRPDGRPWQELVLHMSPQRDQDGILEGLFCIGQDLTQIRVERREAELAIEDLTRLIRTVNAPLIGVDSDGIVNEWNRKAELLTGYTSQEALGRNLVKHFITEEFADPVQLMLSQGLLGQDMTNCEFSLFTKGGQRREILMSASPRRDREGKVVGVIGVGKDITELRSESKMLANYVRICGAAVWSLRGHSVTGAVFECKTKEIENLISQQAQMDICDPRMVLWRASFVSILKTMCQNFWMRRKGEQSSDKEGSTSPPVTERTEIASWARPTSDFGYEFCFEAPNGQVKWYKVEGHLIEESFSEGKFEVTGSMQEVTSMWIDKALTDRWQKWWSRMCHMVFDATLLVDTQEYRVLNAWGEEKVFGCKLQSNHPVLSLIKPEDTVSLKEAFNEVTFKGFERGRTLHLLCPGGSKEMPAQCFLLSADQENPNECMMGIRMQVNKSDKDDCSVLWDVAKPNQVLTLEDLARLKSGLKRNRRPCQRRPLAHRKNAPRSSGPHTSSQSLSSIPEDLHGESRDGEDEFEEEQSDVQSVSGASVKSGADFLQSSSGSSVCSPGSGDGEISEVGVCDSSPPRSLSEGPSATSRRDPVRFATGGAEIIMSSSPTCFSPSLHSRSRHRPAAHLRDGPLVVKLRWSRKNFELNMDEFKTVEGLREHIQSVTAIPASRQTLILAGKRLPLNSEDSVVGEPTWDELRRSIRPGQMLMLVGTAGDDSPTSRPGLMLREADPAPKPLAPHGPPEGSPPEDRWGEA